MTSFLLISAITLWGLSFVATKLCLDYLSPAEIIAARFVLALPVLATITKLKRLSCSFIKKDMRLLMGCSLVLVAHLLIQVEGMKTTTATNTAWLIATIPVFILALSYFFLKERINLRQGIGVALAITGVIILVSRGKLNSLEFVNSYGDWLVLTSCLTWSVYTILGKRLTGGHPLAVTTVVLAMAAIILVPPVIIGSGIEPYMNLPMEIIFALAFLGLFCLGLAYWCWSEALRRKSAGEVGVYLYLEPLVTTAVAPMVLGEEIITSLVGGGVLVIAGVWMVRKNGQRIADG